MITVDVHVLKRTLWEVDDSSRRTCIEMYVLIKFVIQCIIYGVELTIELVFTF